MWRSALLLALLAGAAAAQLRQRCFCSELWACVTRKGFPYSECDGEGRRVICCVQQDPNPDPRPLPLPPVRGRTAATTSPTTVTSSHAGLTDSHFRFSTGSNRMEGVMSTTVGPFFETTRLSLPQTTQPSSRPAAFSMTTPAAIVADTTRFSPLDGFDVRLTSSPGDRFPSTSVSPFPERNRPSTDGDFTGAVTSAGVARYQDDVVTPRTAVRIDTTPRPSSGQRSQHRARLHKEVDYDDSAQEIDWDDGEPHATWSGEDFKPLRQPRLRHEQPREAKKLPWDEQKNKKPTIAVPWSSWRDCGYKGSDSGLEGTAEPSEWPWHAALLEAASDRYVCGAALVGPTWLLTAAHCVMDYPDPGSLKVRVGELDVRSDTESFTQERAVVDVVPHPGFDLPTLRHDIALVRIARAPRDHRNVAAVCLPQESLLRYRSARQGQDADEDLAEEDFPREGSNCVVTGWGRRDEESPHSEVLKEIVVPLWSRRNCQDALRQHLGGSFLLPSTAVCAGAKGRDACDGDGGGPMVCQAQPGGRWFQVGIVSYGIGCGRNGSPGVYTRVSRYASWIKSVAGNLRSFDSGGTPLNGVARQPALQGAPVSRVRFNHYVASTSTTSKPPNRNVLVLTDEDEDQDESRQEEVDKSRELQGTTLSPQEEDAATTELPRRTTAAPRRTSIAANLVPDSDRVGRVIHHHHRNNVEQVHVEPAQRNSSNKAHPFSAGTSFIRTSFGTSEWSYPVEVQSKNKTKSPVKVGMPGRWYSPNYTGSYRGEAAGTRVPGQILSNVAGKTVGGLNRWYSPYYTGSYRGGYNVKESAGSTNKNPTDADENKQQQQQQRGFNVRPPLAQNRWYDRDNRWYMAYHNGTYRSGHVQPHRFSKQDDAAKAAEEKGDSGDPGDLTWTYLVQTGTQGTVITLDRSNNATNVSSTGNGDQGSASSWSHPVVTLDDSRAGRTLVNISNTFSYPSAPKPGTRNSSSSGNSSAHHHNNLSSSYSIYRIYPSVYNPEYKGRSRAAKVLSAANSVTATARAGDLKPTESSTANDIGPRITTPDDGRNNMNRMPEAGGNVVGYSHFSSGDTAVHFNITRDMPENRTADHVTTARTSTMDSTTGGEGMDMPPVQERGPATTEGSDLTSTPGDYSTTSDSNPSTTASMLESMVTVSGLDSISTTDPNSVESTTPAAREPDSEGIAIAGRLRGAEGDGSPRLSTLLRRGGRTDSRGGYNVNTTQEEPKFVSRRRRPEAEVDTAWGERTSSARTTSGRGRAFTSSRAGNKPKQTLIEDVDIPKKEMSSLEIEAAPKQRSRQWGKVHDWPVGEGATTASPRRPAGFHPGVRESKVVLHRSRISSPESESEEPAVVVISPETFEHLGSRGGKARSSAPRRPVAAAPEQDTEQPEVVIPRAKSRNRQGEFRRRGTSGTAVFSPTPSLATPSSSEIPVAAEPPSAPVQEVLEQTFTSPAQRSSQPRSFGSKKYSRKLKKIVFTSAEEQAVQESVYPRQRQQQQQHTWTPAPIVSASPVDVEEVAADAVSGGRSEHAAVEDLEREDVYSFISQRAKRRRLNAGKATSERTETGSEEHDVPVPATRVAGRGARRRPPPQIIEQ